MSKQFKPAKVYNFVLCDRELAAKGGQISFSSYTDMSGEYTGEPGRAAIYVTSKDGQGRDKGKYFNLSQQHYNFVVREGEKDIYGRRQFDYLANHPNCKDSPNGTYLGEGDERIQIGIVFKLMDTEGDAEVALETAKRKARAESIALEIDDATLQDIAAHIGIFGEANDLMRHQVYQWAGRKPIDYFEVLNSGDRAIRAIVRKALQEGIFTKKGEVIQWSGTLIGSNEDDAVSKLMREKDVLQALEKKMGLSNEVKVKGKPGPKTALAK
jgi:hypothetical protein